MFGTNKVQKLQFKTNFQQLAGFPPSNTIEFANFTTFLYNFMEMDKRELL